MGQNFRMTDDHHTVNINKAESRNETGFAGSIAVDIGYTTTSTTCLSRATTPILKKSLKFSMRTSTSATSPLSQNFRLQITHVLD